MSSSSADSTEYVNKKRLIDRDSFGTHMVQVKAGPNKTLFTLHKKILCDVAPYFKAAFEGGFVEATDQTLELPDEDSTMFEHFELWVYTGKFLANGESEANISWESLVGLYIFGKIRGVPDLQNAAIDVLIDKQSSLNEIPTNQLSRIYDCTPEDSPLRRLFVDWMACLPTIFPNDRHTPTPAGAPYQWFKEPTRKLYPKDFLFDLVFALSQLRTGSRTAITNFKSERADYYVKPRATTSKPPASGQK